VFCRDNKKSKRYQRRERGGAIAWNELEGTDSIQGCCFVQKLDGGGLTKKDTKTEKFSEPA